MLGAGPSWTVADATGLCAVDFAGWSDTGIPTEGVRHTLCCCPLGCLVAEQRWDPVGLAIVQQAHRFQHLTIAAPGQE